nr:SJCHGC09795 protein [Schistosoma japonicum]
MESLTEDLALKSSRRQQIIDKIVNSAKNEVEKARQLADARASAQSNLLRQINDDMSNKENSRRHHLQNIVQQCQSEIEKVESVRSRRSVSNSIE